ncbi:hypothetical protein [Corynebacterium urogenitale]
MPSMFPSMASSGDDANRQVKRWKPGDPTPRIVLAASVVIVIVAVMMVLSGVMMLTADWNRPPVDAAEAERMDFVRRNVQILGGVNVVTGAIITWLALSLREGYRNRRRWMLWVSCLAIFLMLLGWVFGFTGTGQALLSLGLAVGLLMAFRPAADPFFDAGHRLEAPIEGDGTVPGDDLRG